MVGFRKLARLSEEERDPNNWNQWFLSLGSFTFGASIYYIRQQARCSQYPKQQWTEFTGNPNLSEFTACLFCECAWKGCYKALSPTMYDCDGAALLLAVLYGADHHNLTFQVCHLLVESSCSVFQILPQNGVSNDLDWDQQPWNHLLLGQHGRINNSSWVLRIVIASKSLFTVPPLQDWALRNTGGISWSKKEACVRLILVNEKWWPSEPSKPW